MHNRRVETTSPRFRVAVLTWDDATGNALRIEYAADRELRREPVHLGRRPLT